MAKRGRPPIARPRAARFEVRCTPEMHSLTVALAALGRGTLSDLWHNLVLRDAREWLSVGSMTQAQRAVLLRVFGKTREEL